MGRRQIESTICVSEPQHKSVPFPLFCSRPDMLTLLFRGTMRLWRVVHGLAIQHFLPASNPSDSSGIGVSLFGRLMSDDKSWSHIDPLHINPHPRPPPPHHLLSIDPSLKIHNCRFLHQSRQALLERHMRRVLMYIIVSILLVLELHHESVRVVLQNASANLYSIDNPGKLLRSSQDCCSYPQKRI